ncbi:hypothetical protein ACLB2K_073674 [Fragaria x ananassa]
MAEELKILEAMPQLMVASDKAVEAADFYGLLFGAEIIRHNEFPVQNRTSDSYYKVACVELRIGSSSLVVRDMDTINSRVVRNVAYVSTCLRVQCLNVDLLMEKAVNMGCTVVKEILEDPVRPGVLVSIIRDPFGHIWELSDSSCGVSEDGFMHNECMNVLLQGGSNTERKYNQELLESYQCTPVVGSCKTIKNATDVIPTVRIGGSYDPILFDCKYMAVSTWLQEELSYEGTLVGLADPSTSFKDRERCLDKGADLVVEKPLNLKKITHILFQSLKKKKKIKEKMKLQ